MKTISVREFQQNMYKYLGELPLCITKYNKPSFYIVKNAPEESQADGEGRPDVSTENVSRANVVTPDVQSPQ